MKKAWFRDFVFRLRYRFRGVPRSIMGYDVKLDETLRRWDVNAESPVQEILKKYLHAGDVFIDVGANFGLHTLLGAKLVGNSGKVFAVEPVSFNLKLLERNIRLNHLEKTVSVKPYALLANVQSFVEMQVEEGLSVAASLSSSKDLKKIKVPSSTIDECFIDNHTPPKLIKIDVEGAEHEVLKGAVKLLSEHRPLLLIEVHTFALPRFGSSAEKLTAFLHSLGYEEEKISETRGVAGDYYHAVFSHKSN